MLFISVLYAYYMLSFLDYAYCCFFINKPDKK